jgi:solute carrier family 25 (mitochondrial S-adenosylmethionine transporter), member 26
MAGSFPGAATFWATYEASKSALTPYVGALAAPAAAAATADVAVVAVRNPFEVVKQQMQSGMHKTTTDAVRTILRVDGVRGFYAGYASTVLREIPFDAIGEDCDGTRERGGW